MTFLSHILIWRVFMRARPHSRPLLWHVWRIKADLGEVHSLVSDLWERVAPLKTGSEWLPSSVNDLSLYLWWSKRSLLSILKGTCWCYESHAVTAGGLWQRLLKLLPGGSLSELLRASSSTERPPSWSQTWEFAPLLHAWMTEEHFILWSTSKLEP